MTQLNKRSINHRLASVAACQRFRNVLLKAGLVDKAWKFSLPEHQALERAAIIRIMAQRFIHKGIGVVAYVEDHSNGQERIYTVRVGIVN